jgi:hypothetical protein
MSENVRPTKTAPLIATDRLPAQYQRVGLKGQCTDVQETFYYLVSRGKNEYSIFMLPWSSHVFSVKK